MIEIAVVGVSERPQGEGIAWGLDEEESPIRPDDMLIEEAYIPGHRVNAFHLRAVAVDFGDAEAEALDAACRPCLICGLNFYDPLDEIGICHVCEAQHTEGSPAAYQDARAGSKE